MLALGYVMMLSYPAACADLASEKLELVKKVIVRLKTALEESLLDHSQTLAIRPLPVDEFLQNRDAHAVLFFAAVPRTAC